MGRILTLFPPILTLFLPYVCPIHARLRLEPCAWSLAPGALRLENSANFSRIKCVKMFDIFFDKMEPCEWAPREGLPF